MAQALGVSPSLIVKLAKRGMPMDDPVKAREWRLAYTRQGPRGKRSGEILQFDFVAPTGEEENLQETLGRLRKLERTTSITIERLLAKDEVPKAIALRQQHASMIKSLFDCETKALRLAQDRGELISLQAAEEMVINALREPVMLARQLPGLARDQSQKSALEAFANGLLEAIKSGAAGSLNGADRAKEAL